MAIVDAVNGPVFLNCLGSGRMLRCEICGVGISNRTLQLQAARRRLSQSACVGLSSTEQVAVQ